MKYLERIARSIAAGFLFYGSLALMEWVPLATTCFVAYFLFKAVGPWAVPVILLLCWGTGLLLDV